MKKKTINAIISKKMLAWIDSIDDKDLQRKVKEDVIVTGGCITSMLLNEDINDFDVYFKTKSTLKAVCQYYANKFNENNAKRENHIGHPLKAWVLDGEDVEAWKQGQKKLDSFAYGYPDIGYADRGGYKNVSVMVYNTPSDRIKMMINSDGVAEDSDAVAEDSDAVAEDSDAVADKVEYNVEEYVKALNDADETPAATIEQGKYKPVFLSSNAITLSDKIQVVVRFYGTPGEIHKNYDFVHTTQYWTFATGVMLNQAALEAIINKELHYVGSKYPICSLVRSRKFIKRGWHINAGQFVKIAWQISELDLSDICVLEDQLVGVDSVYFLKFIDGLKKQKLADPNFSLTGDYLTSVIDRIFG
jgi:hypothetical protein